MKMSRVALVAASFVVSFSFGDVARADMLVVRSLGGAARAFPPGRSLPETASLTLGAGDSVTLLGARGTRTFRGPGTFQLAAAARSGSMAAAIGQPRARSRIGAVRGSTAAQPSFPADVSRGGNICLADGWNLALWRSDATQTMPLTIEARPGEPVRSEWPQGRALLDWPSAVPVVSGQTISVGLGSGAPVPLRFVDLGPGSRDRQQAAAEMIRHECWAQLDRLVETAQED